MESELRNLTPEERREICDEMYARWNTGDCFGKMVDRVWDLAQRSLRSAPTVDAGPVENASEQAHRCYHQWTRSGHRPVPADPLPTTEDFGPENTERDLRMLVEKSSTKRLHISTSDVADLLSRMDPAKLREAVGQTSEKETENGK
jgi:hypothetical protein